MNKITPQAIAFIDKLKPCTNLTKEGLAMITAQCHHESMGFTRLEENLNYSQARLLKVFPKYFNQSNVDNYINNPQAIANRVYANRMGNGNEQSGDGYNYRGRGYIQLTGKNNYILYGELLSMDFINNPTYLTVPLIAIKVAYKYFVQNKILNSTDIVLVTRKINGGLHGLDDREQLYNMYLDYLI